MHSRILIASVMIALTLVAIAAPNVCVFVPCCEEEDSDHVQEFHICGCLCSVVARCPDIIIEPMILNEVRANPHAVICFMPEGVVTLPERPPIAAC